MAALSPDPDSYIQSILGTSSLLSCWTGGDQRRWEEVAAERSDDGVWRMSKGTAGGAGRMLEDGEEMEKPESVVRPRQRVDEPLSDSCFSTLLLRSRRHRCLQALDASCDPATLP
jgi:hypothetical protein